MKTTNASIVAVAIAAGFSISGSAFGNAVSAASGAADLFALITFDGTDDVETFNQDLLVGPVNSVSGSFPPYDIPGPILRNPGMFEEVDLVPGSFTGGVALTASLLILNPLLETRSDVDGAPGARIVESHSNLSFATGEILTDGISRVSVGYISATAPVSSASVTWDGTTLTPSGSSNLLSPDSGAFVTLSVLGVPLLVPALTSASPTAVIPVNLDQPGTGTAVGTITLSADVVDLSNDGITATAEAASLVADLNLTLDFPVVAGSRNVTIDGLIVFNSTSATMTVTPVPEPSGTLLMLTGLLLSAHRRRRA